MLQVIFDLGVENIMVEALVVRQLLGANLGFAIQNMLVQVWDVAGPLCFSGDMVVKERELVNMEVSTALLV